MADKISLLEGHSAPPPTPQDPAACPLLAALLGARALCFQRSSYLEEVRDRPAGRYKNCILQHELGYTVFRFDAGVRHAGAQWWENAASHRGTEPLLRLAEASTTASRRCWGSRRPFSMTLSLAGAGASAPTIAIERPLRLSLLCVSRPCLTVRHSALGVLGTVRQPFAPGLALELRGSGGASGGGGAVWLRLRLGLAEAARQLLSCTRTRLRLEDGAGGAVGEVASVLVKTETHEGRDNFGGPSWERALGSLVDWQPRDGLGLRGTVVELPEGASGAQRALLVAAVVQAHLAWLDAANHRIKGSVYDCAWSMGLWAGASALLYVVLLAALRH